MKNAGRCYIAVPVLLSLHRRLQAVTYLQTEVCGTA